LLVEEPRVDPSLGPFDEIPRVLKVFVAGERAAFVEVTNLSPDLLA